MAYLFFFLYSVFSFSLETKSITKATANKQTTAQHIDNSALIANPVTNQKLIELAKHPLWLRLLHFDQPKRSKVINPEFFASKNIKSDSAAELVAFWSALQFTPVNDDHVMCRFPARTLFIYQQLAPTLKPNFSACNELSEFVVRASINSVSVVFSSYYLYNPSSAFGHSLLKINRKTNDNDLMNYGIGFAANVDTSNPIMYGIKGFAGLFHGVFTAVPYYYKVREYNDYESRDLWSYQLNLTDEEKELLIYHIWELGHLWAPYFYFDENCSYWVLRVLEAASLRLNLKNHLPSTHVIPIDSIRALYRQENFVESILLRPSLRKKVSKRFKLLSNDELSKVKKVVHRMTDSSFDKNELADLKNTLQIDAALDYYDYKNAKVAARNEQEFEAKKRLLLIHRSLAHGPPHELDFDNEIPPHKFHPSAMFGLGGGVQANDKPYTVLRFRPALHDLIDPHQGFDFSSEINFFDSEARIYQKDNDDWSLRLHKLDLIRFSVLTPMDQIDMKPAWRFNTGLQPFAQKSSRRSSSLFFAVAPGLSVYTPFTQQKSITYFLLHSEANQLSSLNHNFALRTGPVFGTLTSITDNFKITFDLKYLFDYQFTSKWEELFLARVQAQYYFTSADMAVMADFEAWNDFAEASLNFKYYF